MSYARPSPGPGEIYDCYGPPKPSMGNASFYARSQVGGTQPRRLPPQQYPSAGPSYRGANFRPGLRSYDDAGFDQSPRHSPGRPPYNNSYSYSKSPDCADFGYHRHPTRPSAMSEDNSRNFRKPSSTSRPHDARNYHNTQDFNRGLPMRTGRPRTADESYVDREKTEPALDNNQDSGEAQGSWSWDKLKKTVWGNTTPDAREPTQSLQENRAQEDIPPENQNTLWANLASVGASFQKKIQREDGYASDASDYEGESHLIRIMKRYHIDKAESTHDLPDWLFSQAELMQHSRTKGSSLADPNGPERRPGRYEEEEMHYQRGDPAGRGRSSLSDIYDSVDQDRNNHSRNGSSAKQSFDSGYGSSSNAPRRRGRHDDSRSEFTESKPLGKNRLATHNDQAARYHPSSNHHNPRQPPNNIPLYPDRSRLNEPRRLRSAPTRAPASSYGTPTVVDYSRPSGQDDRYPIPRPKYQPSYGY